MKKRKLRKLAIICILVLILIVIFMLFFNPFLHLSLKGKKTITVEVNESFKDPLVNATFFGKDVSDDVSKTKIKTDKIGRYTVEYKLKKGWTVKKVKRTVEVVDTTKPEIALVGNTTVSLKVGESYVEPGFTVNTLYSLIYTSLYFLHFSSSFFTNPGFARRANATNPTNIKTAPQIYGIR